MGTSYHVSKLDHGKKEIHVEETKTEYYTKSLVNSEIFIKEKYIEKILLSCKNAKVGLGAVEVVEQVTGYKKFRYFSETVIGEESLEMPKLSLETIALWVELPDRFTELFEKHDRDFAGGIHAIEQVCLSNIYFMITIGFLHSKQEPKDIDSFYHQVIQCNYQRK